MSSQIQNAGSKGAQQHPERVMPMTFGGADKPVGKTPRQTVLTRDGGNLPLEYFLDVPIEMIFEVGRVDITIRQMLELTKGSYIELRNVLVDVIDIRVNDKIMAHGETVALQGRYGIRFNELEEFTSVEDLENGS